MIGPSTRRPGLQLWCVREELATHPERTLAALKAAGFDEVEPFTADEFPELAEALRQAGLAVTSVHEHLIDVDVDRALDVAQSLGATTVIESWTDPDRWQSDSSIADLSDSLNSAARIAAQRGMRVGYHNHDHEFTAGPDGTPRYFSFVDQLSNDVSLQLDLGTIALAGLDPVNMIERFQDRIESVHVLGERDAASLVLQNPHGEVAARIRAIPPHARVILEVEDGPFSSVTRALSAIDLIGAQT